MEKKNISEREIRELIARVEHKSKRVSQKDTKEKNDMYKNQTDRNYKDGDRN